MLKKLRKITTFPPIHQISPKLFYHTLSILYILYSYDSFSPAVWDVTTYKSRFEAMRIIIV